MGKSNKALVREAIEQSGKYSTEGIEIVSTGASWPEPSHLVFDAEGKALTLAVIIGTGPDRYANLFDRFGKHPHISEMTEFFSESEKRRLGFAH